MIENPRRLSPIVAARAAFAVAIVIFSVVFIANCWVGDDAYISFRVSDNFIHGYGLRWNVAERVQAFTNPLWTLLMAAAGWISGEFFYTSMVVSFVLCLVMLAIAWRWLGRAADGWLALALLLSSKAFVDYSSSGLEYPLCYLLLVAFVVVLLAGDRFRPPSGAAGIRHDRLAPDRLAVLVFIASLSFMSRADAILLYLPSLAWLLLQRFRGLGWRDYRRLAVASAPAWGWLLFALVYYGFPFPNTYYAKAASGIPQWLQFRQGLAYAASSLRFDPITLATIAAAIGVAWVAGSTATRAIAVGVLAYVFYTVRVGGDFMAGRFFALPFLASTLLLATVPKRRSTALAAVALLIVLNVVNPLAPIKTIPSSDIGWSWRLQNGVKDERGAIASGVNPLTFEIFRRMPDNLMAREGRSLNASPEKVLVHPWIGVTGFYAGPTKYIIDPNALADPLLARLPIPPDFYFAFWVSHFTRALPTGYLESRRAGTNLIEDRLIHHYFDKILNVTTGPIFSWSRVRDIFDLNWRLRDFKDHVKTTQRLEATVKVSNPLFWTEAGELNPRNELITATGKAGYLLIGPGVPIAPGTYAVRWTGTLEQAAKNDLGFVEVCYEDCRTKLGRGPIAASDNGTLAELLFRAPQDARDVEFRMYVNENSGLTLATVAISESTLR